MRTLVVFCSGFNDARIEHMRDTFAEGLDLGKAAALERWFESKPEYRNKVEDAVNASWDKLVIAPLLRLAEESAPRKR